MTSGLKWVHERNAREISFVASDDQAVIRFGHCGDNHVQATTRASNCLSFGHEPPPDKRCVFVKREDPPGKQGLRTLRAGKPRSQLVPFPTLGQLKYSTLDFGDCERSDEQGLLFLCRHPGSQCSRWYWPRRIRNNVGIEEIAGHRRISRPSSRGRVRSMSLPTRGDRRSAAQTLLPVGGSTGSGRPSTTRTVSALT